MSPEDDRYPAGSTTRCSKILHFLHCALFLFVFAIFESIAFHVHEVQKDIDPWTRYGTYFPLILYFIRYFTLLIFPLMLLQFCGLFFYNAFHSKVEQQVSSICAPFICFRVVTRGDFPYLVRENIQQNIECCKEAGLKNYSFELVTDKCVNLPSQDRVHEIVVPSEYQTKKGALFKARALQYCLEDDVNKLDDKSWIVHLDEETLLTTDSLRGILNFVTDGKHPFGQGLVTYAGARMVNWFTTLADSIRLGTDMGYIRAQFKMFHKPLNGWKGSFMVCQVGAERSVSFDNGPYGSIIEDCFFGFKAYEAGYTFNFINGHMIERSPFTIKDFIHQRKRWFRGTSLILQSQSVPVRIKIFFYATLYCLPLSILNIVLTPFFPIPCPLLVDMITGFCTSMFVFSYVYGAIKCFMLSPFGKLQCLLCVIGAVCMIPLFIALENLSALLAFLDRKYKFHVVDKAVAPTTKIM